MNVSKSFDQRTILNDVSFRFDGPGSLAVMGPSGTGKTTVLGIIAGAESLDSGRVHVDGKDSDSSIAWIVQSSPLLTRRTVIENVLLGAICRGLPLTDAQTNASVTLSDLLIEDLATKQIRYLSGGERQRVAVARGIASEASVLLADEPTASLDPEARSAVCDALERTSRSGRIVIIATHDPYVASRCDRVIRLEDGKVLEHKTP
ncbi:ATP-binding cassette domain-containing protein [Microbacterium sp. KUDC0406]|uniref:ABC transporter ATP-binding protein n=1 Tax=Microbacterium sp. KUDC0406 TaxID=2909588 RepID=UPI001F2280F3|nr:ATP-binding cassette domain-containing protein [Microbacterium sp. KUDC0406]UJP09308.1 ATP-binding cassette domain-containing protein [Microbacterium sp. KUDC0406]